MGYSNKKKYNVGKGDLQIPQTLETTICTLFLTGDHHVQENDEEAVHNPTLTLMI